MTDLEFDNRIEWTGSGRTGVGAVHTGGHVIACSVPASMGGKGEGPSPEDLLVCAVANCYTATLGALLARDGLAVKSLHVAARGTVADFPEKARIAEIMVSPTFAGGDESRRQEYEALAGTARDRCFVGRHLAPEVAYRVGEVGFAADASADAKAGTLDVRSIPPARRHQLIFGLLDDLPAGQAVTLVNDHDPLPLRYQLEATRGDGYSWDYLEEGPEVWRVRIGRQ